MGHATGIAGAVDRRIVELDGLRGLMTVAVVISHYFGEVPGGVSAVMFGWVAVDVFFVLSGFLIGRLVLDRMRHANFFAVFYLRRALRLLPVYGVAVLLVVTLIAAIDRPWTEAERTFPLWAYLTFTQNIFMAAEGHYGAHWLSPTWTLAVEEHFYLLAPVLLVFVPRRFLVPVLLAGVTGAVALRIAVHGCGLASPLVSLALLPGRADLLLCGVLAAIALRHPAVQAGRLDEALRLLPLAAILVVLALLLVSRTAFDILNPLILGIGCASLILALTRGAPEGIRFRSRHLRFLGDTSYAVYLTHLPVLGLCHGLAFGAAPALHGPAHWVVTAVALLPCIGVGWLLTKLVEAPCTQYGRSFRWSDAERPAVRTPGIVPT